MRQILKQMGIDLTYTPLSKHIACYRHGSKIIVNSRLTEVDINKALLAALCQISSKYPPLCPSTANSSTLIATASQSLDISIAISSNKEDEQHEKV